MSNSLNTAAAGMKTQQAQIDTIANNIANVNTTGFKKSRIDVNAASYSTMISSSLDSNSKNLQKGSGAIAANQTKDFSQGMSVHTGRNLDIAIEGNGFIALENDQGNQEYTKSGIISIRSAEGVKYLANPNGDFVLDRNGNRIRVNFPPEQIVISSKGEVSDGANESFAQIAIYNFENISGLSESGAGKYSPTVFSGQPILAAVNDSVIKSGYLESSNSNLIEEMSQLIKSQRAYTFLSRAITTADNIKSIENDIRR